MKWIFSNIFKIMNIVSIATFIYAMCCLVSKTETAYARYGFVVLSAIDVAVLVLVIIELFKAHNRHNEYRGW
jgi:uncharacterized membrane protein